MAWWWHQQDESATNENQASSTQSPTLEEAAPTTKRERSAEAEEALQELRELLHSADPAAADAAWKRTQELADAPARDDNDALSLIPTTMSCVQTFDLAYKCSSLGGQLRNVYRYGEMRSCSDWWAQWRFCMRTKAMSEEQRRLSIRQWNLEKAARQRMGNNSEMVWQLRQGADDVPSK